MSRSRFMSTAIALLLLASPALADDQSATIKVTRPSAPRLTYDTHAVVEQAIQTTRAAAAARGPETSRTTFKADLTGRVAVRTVDAQGRPTSLTLSINNLRRATGQDMIKPGTIIDISLNASQATFTPRDGAPINNEVKTALIQFFPKLPKTDVSDDQILGTLTPRKLGEIWSVNIDAAARELASRDLKTTPVDIHGSVCFKAVEASDTGPAFRLLSTLDVKNIVPPSNVPGFTINDASMKSQTSQLLPADPTQLPLECESNILVTERLISNAVNSSAAAELVVEVHTRQSFAPVKTATATALPK